MNPSIEVQITARLDKLDAALKVAEAKIGSSAVTMGKAGEQGGSMFVDKMVGNMVKGLAMGAVSNVIGNGILTALQGVNAGKSGEQIGMDISKGIIDGAKSIPVVGTVVAILDEMINGMDRLAAAAHDRAATVADSFRRAFHDIAKTSEITLQVVTRKTEDMAAKADPVQQAKLNTQRTIEDANAGIKKIEDDKKMLRQLAASQEAKAIQAAVDDRNANAKSTMASNGKIVNEDEINKVLADRRRDAASTRLAEEQRIEKMSLDLVKALNAQKVQAAKTGIDDLAKIEAENNSKADAAQKTAQDKAEAEQTKFALEVLANFKKQKKDEYDAAVQAQQDIIDAEKQAQAQIDKVGRVDQLASQAARGMINSGQTALGQFNFAQQGAGGTALDMAKKQVMSLEKIEAATAEQVRLTKENKGFQ
jgi:hypothetical protein